MVKSTMQQILQHRFTKIPNLVAQTQQTEHKSRKSIKVYINHNIVLQDLRVLKRSIIDQSYNATTVLINHNKNQTLTFN